MSFFGFLGEILSRNESLILSGAVLNFLPKKISNYIGSIYFFLIFLGVFFLEQFNPSNLWLSSSFCLTFILLSFSNSKKLPYLVYDQKFEINYKFLIFVYYFLTKSIFLKLFSENFAQFFSNELFFYSFIYLEFASLLTFALFHFDFFKISNESIHFIEFRKKLTLRYLSLHLFLGFLFLISMNFFIKNSQIVDSRNFIIFGIIPLIISLLANSALPFFSFWLTRTYSIFNFTLFLIFSSGISKLSIILLLKLHASGILLPYHQIQIIFPYIGIFSSILFLLLLIHENNIRKFLCLAVLSQNFLFLILDHKNLNQTLLHSIFSQSFFFLIIFIILFLNSFKSDFFVELQLKLSSNKLLFFSLILISLILIGAPGTPNFLVKYDSIKFFKNQSHINYYLILIYKTLNIIVFLFVLPYKIFSQKKETQINKFEYKKSLILLWFSLGAYILFFKNQFNFIGQASNFNEFFYQFFASGLIFSFLAKTLIKNFNSFLTSDLIFERLKTFFWQKILIFSKLFDKNLSALSLKIKTFETKNDFFKRNNKFYSIDSSGIYVLFLGLIIFLIFLNIAL